MTPADELRAAAGKLRLDLPSIAAMPPGISAALANWLCDTAALHELDARPGHAGCDWCGDEDFPCADIRNAVAVARALFAQP